MVSTDKIMKNKQVFKNKMDEMLTREESDKAWQDAHSRLAKMYVAYPNLSKGVRAHTDFFIFRSRQFILQLGGCAGQVL